MWKYLFFNIWVVSIPVWFLQKKNTDTKRYLCSFGAGDGNHRSCQRQALTGFRCRSSSRWLQTVRRTVCLTPRPSRVRFPFLQIKKYRGLMTSVFFGAGDGNRTHTTSLEGWSSTTKLHLHIFLLPLSSRNNYILLNLVCQQKNALLPIYSNIFAVCDGLRHEFNFTR